jgi:hypothetical protein
LTKHQAEDSWFITCPERSDKSMSCVSLTIDPRRTIPTQLPAWNEEQAHTEKALYNCSYSLQYILQLLDKTSNWHIAIKTKWTIEGDLDENTVLNS